MTTSSGMSLSSEHVQRLLQCAVCLERFKQPKILPCQHTFCLTPCLEGLVDRRTRSIRCPECRADHFVPRNGPASFPNNLTVIGFLELAGPAGEAVENMSRNQVVETLHQSSRVSELRRPQRVSSPQQNVQESAAADGSGCAVCRGEGRVSRCCHCDQLVCEECRHFHMQQVKADVTRMISQVRRGLPHISEQIIAVGRKSSQLQSNCEHVKSDISEALDKHIRELKARERTLREDVDNFLAGELRNLRAYQENAEVEIASLSSFCDSVESVLSMSRPIPDGDLVEMRGQCQEHLESVQCYEDGTIRPPNVKMIQASLESPFLSSTISNYGDLIITSRAAPLRQTPDDDPYGRTPLPYLPAINYNEGSSGFSVGLQTESRLAASPAMSPGTSRRLLLRASDTSGFDDGYQSETRAISPFLAAPRTQASSPNRASQVRFEEESRMGDSGWANQGSQTHRRSRYDRRSDTRLASLASVRGPASSQQAIDRTRHLSLVTLPVTSEFDSEPEDSETAVGRLIVTPNRQEGRDDHVGGLPHAASFPGARSFNFLPPVLRISAAVREDDESPREPTPEFNSNSPSLYVSTPRNKYNQKGTALVRFGQRGSDIAQFTWPRGVSVSPMDDSIYVADSSNHRVQVFDSTGKFLKTFGQHGQGEGDFDCLAGVAINGLGQVIIADRYNHRIQIFDRCGRFQNAFGSEGSGEGQLNYPWGLACDNMGFIYVCNKENHRVQVFQSNGTYVRMFGRLGTRPGEFENPHYIAVSPDNKVYVSDSSNHRVQVFSMYGDFLFTFGTCGALRGQMKFPRGIAVDNQGFVVVADSGNNRVQIFRADGRFYSMFGGWGNENGQFKGLEGLAILTNGNIVVSDRENHRIQIF
ncbi:RING finger protein nhl-1-like [Biomphalaria glabrata]|uniref:RING finger protein nhl-1-like n=1 Tax=Biomphalaria glabrata TaxID=6526 RepID=A0A9U8EKN5_BIOGL|nr:RING finger protein nhl-1-like [Biomphalaria glabrata]XP_055874016.1 RING finger protein nhl-1-like [Biomphalaria glabrata]